MNDRELAGLLKGLEDEATEAGFASLVTMVHEDIRALIDSRNDDRDSAPAKVDSARDEAVEFIREDQIRMVIDQLTRAIFTAVVAQEVIHQSVRVALDGLVTNRILAAPKVILSDPAHYDQPRETVISSVEGGSLKMSRRT